MLSLLIICGYVQLPGSYVLVYSNQAYMGVYMVTGYISLPVNYSL